MSDITTINGSDRVKDSRAVINANFEALNEGKVEQADFENALPAIEGNPGEIPYVEEGTITSSPKFVWNNEDNTLTIYPDPEDLDKYFQLQGGEGINQIRSNGNDLFVSTDLLLSLFGASAQIGATDGDVKLQNSIGLLDSDATKGFIQIPACDGMPTGVPDDIVSGLVHMVYDATNDKLYVYNEGWQEVGA